MTQQTRIVHLNLERTTKGAIKFQEIDKDGKPSYMYGPGTCFGSIYVRKTALHGVEPKQIQITMTYDDGDDDNNG